jgi:hypothetical protein
MSGAEETYNSIDSFITLFITLRQRRFGKRSMDRYRLPVTQALGRIRWADMSSLAVNARP